MKVNAWLWLGMVGLGIAACDPGQLAGNQPPDTSFFLDGVGLDSARLTTVVQMHWLGTDPDGYVEGYELSVDGGDWFFTQRTDSTFRFDIEAGSLDADVDLRVRAIDNLGAADPEPAQLTLPVRNTPPTARFNPEVAIPDTAYSVLSFTWSVADLEGVETIDSVFLRINEGDWYYLSPGASFATLLSSDTRTPGVQPAQLLLGSEARPMDELLTGLNNGGRNRLYLQARDLSGAFSEVDTSAEFFLQPQRSDLLIVNAHQRREAVAFTRSMFDEVAQGDYDWLDLRASLPSFWEPTFSLYLRLYDRIYWFGDGQPISGQGETYILEQAANGFQAYLNEGKKLMMSTPFNPVFNDPERQAQSLIFDFSPADSLSTAEGQARLPRQAAVYGQGPWSDLDTLRASAFLTGVDPFYAKSADNALAQAALTPVGGWTGPSVVAARSTFSNNETNQVFFSVEIHLLDGDPTALRGWFERIFNQDFNW
jgi:hypothetical protein